MTRPLDAIAVAAVVADALGSLGLPYSIGGSLASSVSGEPRSTLDIDMVVAFEERDAAAIAAALGDQFYVDERAVARAARDRSSVNAIHVESSIKVDMFAAGGSALDGEILRRRLLMTFGDERDEQLWVHSAEDILLQKLRWYGLGGASSDRQWRDVLGLVRVQGDRLDLAYLKAGAQRLGVVDLLNKALNAG